jgi:hypothetical protein
MINCGGLWQLGQAATSDYLSGFGSNISRQSLAKRPPAIASRSISRSSARISRPTCALCRASARFSFVNRPCVVCAAAIRARPSSVRGPVDLPPCRVQRPVCFTAGRWQGVPALVRAPQRSPDQSGPKRVAEPILLPFSNRMRTPNKTVMI